MRFLVAGVTGQLGAGVVEALPQTGHDAVALARAIGARSAQQRVARAHRGAASIAGVVSGDVTLPRWGLSDADVRALAPEVDGVLDLAAETDWSAPRRRLHAVNFLGALHGLDVARALHDAGGGRCRLYCYASSIHAAGGRRGSIPEAPFGPDGARTAYERTKWLAETALIESARDGGPRVAVARVGGLVGSSTTGATAKRNSLYLLGKYWERLPGGVLPLAPGGRVDMLPRDVAAAVLLRFAAACADDRDRGPAIVHVAAGEAAPETAALLAVARSLDAGGRLGRARVVTVPETWIARAAENAHRLLPLEAGWRNALLGLRYVSFDRTFERARLASYVDAPLPAPSIEQLARLAMDLPETPVPPARRGPSLARFEG